MKHCATCTCCTQETATESKFLSFLRANPNKALTRTDIVQGVYGKEFDGLTNVVDVYVFTLRQKYHAPIKTVRGIGYMLVPPARHDLF